jgi:amidase
VSELWRKSALELAATVRSREVVQAHLDRVEAVNPHVNAIVRLLPERFRAGG